MSSYSPTALSTFINNCPAALEFYRANKQSDVLANAEYDIEGPDAAEIGIAFHACMHAAALARKEERGAFPAIEATALALSKKMDPIRANKGRDLAYRAVEWVKFPEGDFKFEFGASFDKDWLVVGWEAPHRRMRLIFDTVGLEYSEDENYGQITTAVGQDYKTGFGARESELDSIQFDAYLAAMKEMYPNADAYRIECIAIRYHRVYTKTYSVNDEEDLTEMQSRIRRLKYFMRSADESDGKPRVGTGCLTCNFTKECRAFADRINNLRETNVDNTKSPEELARDFAALQARTSEILEILKIYAKSEMIKVDNQTLGFQVAEERSLKSPSSILDIFLRAKKVTFTDEQLAAIKVLLEIINPGVMAYDSIVKKSAKALGYKTQKAALEAEGKRDITTACFPKWGWKKVEPEIPAGQETKNEVLQ